MMKVCPDYKHAQQNSDWAFGQRTAAQRMDWLEDVWELQKIGQARCRQRQHSKDNKTNDQGV